jgi:lipoprotein NlpD
MAGCSMRWSSLLPALLGALLLAACVPQRSVRVEPNEASHPAPRSLPAEGDYSVVRGDTLYGIAFRHGLDYRDLAALNGIAAPFTIYPGQRLRLRAVAAAAPPRPVAATPSRPAPPATAPSPVKPGVVGPIVQGPAVPPGAPPSAPAASPPASGSGSTPNPAVAATPPAPDSASSAPPAATSTPATVPPAATPTPAAPAAAPVVLRPGDPQWRWPAAGSLIGRFVAGDPTRQGINIAGTGGDAVQAAADGVVVYSGAGLIGYGELIIVKHNDTWLSAYGHNRKRLVGEGDAVRAGQTIAEMGRTGTSRDMLHFEVRRNGKPVDPLGVLPKR